MQKLLCHPELSQNDTLYQICEGFLKVTDLNPKSQRKIVNYSIQLLVYKIYYTSFFYVNNIVEPPRQCYISSQIYNPNTFISQL